MSSPFYKEKAKLIADDILNRNNIPSECHHLYDSDEQLKAYLDAGNQEQKEKEAQKKKEADRIASIPHNADLSIEEQEAIALQDKVAKLTGRDKREYLFVSSNKKILERITKIKEGQEADLKLGVMISQSAVKEKTTDWAIAGGIASGIAGPAAGIAVAADTMRKNAEIEERNRHNQAAANQLASSIMSSAFSSTTDTSVLYRQSGHLESKLKELPSKVVLNSIEPDEIQKSLHIDNYHVKTCKSNALELTLEISNTLSVQDAPQGVRFTTDGSLKGTVYAGDLLVDTVNIPLPVFGVACGTKEIVKAYCGKFSKNGKEYTVQFQPNHLWVMEI